MSQQQNYDRVYNYPKSSCDCYECTNKKYKFGDGLPSNLSVPGCKVPDYFQCYDREYISEKMEPVHKEGIEFINPQAYTEAYSDHFGVVDCKKHECDTCTEPQFASWDPRTWSATHNQYLTFDRPPLEGTVKLSEVYDKKLKGYGQGYRTHSDISAGDTLYYIDKWREDPYYSPLFSEPAVKVTKVVYKDPMGGISPEYQRHVPYKNPITDDTCNYDPYCLSSVRDTQMFRDDIMTGILSKHINKQRWESRWT